MRRVPSICFVLAALVLAVYWPVQLYDFLSSDDPAFITENPHVRAGLTWPSIRYALTTSVVGNWHPVTTLSHILDCQVFGVNPGPQHLVNVVFHAANALLLFLVLRQMTGALWRSAIVAAFFALHPLRVESVAWISERKDVLSAFFFLLTIWAYVRYVEVQSPKSKVQSREAEGQGQKSKVQSLKSKAQSREPSPCITDHASRLTHHASRITFRVSRYYLLCLLFFALGLMSKPMLVTLPFVLLLLDYWPLQRLRLPTRIPQPTARSAPPSRPQLSAFNHQPSTLTALLREKAPFFALAALFSTITFLIQEGAGAMALMAKFTLEDRVSNALVSYVRYLGKVFWPTDLAAIYPHPASRYYLRDQWPGWEICAAGLLLLAVSALCLCQVRRRPYLAVGWFWYLGMMVPVIGLIQAGEQAMADRYTYLPLIGPVLSLVWFLSELVLPPSTSLARASLPLTRGGDGSSPAQTTGLQDMGTSRPRPGSGVQGVSKGRGGLWALAALAVVVLALCSVLTRHQLHYWRNSVALFEHTVEVTADNPGAQFALGVGLEKEGQVRRAMVHYLVAVDILPSYAEAHFNIGHLLREQGAWQRAANEFVTTLRYKPRDLKFHLNLAGVLLEGGQTREAVQRFEEALQIDPDSTEALNNLAWLLAANSDPAIRNGTRAVEYGERACQLTEFKQTTMVGTLAAAYAEAGRFADAVATAEKACALAGQNGEQALLEKNRQLLELYRAGQPYHEPAAR